MPDGLTRFGERFSECKSRAFQRHAHPFRKHRWNTECVLGLRVGTADGRPRRSPDVDFICVLPSGAQLNWPKS